MLQVCTAGIEVLIKPHKRLGKFVNLSKAEDRMGKPPVLLWKLVQFCIFIEILFNLLLSSSTSFGIKSDSGEIQDISNEGNVSSNVYQDDTIVFESENDTDTDLKSGSGFAELKKLTVTFYLYTRKRNGSDLIRYISPSTVMQSHFVPGAPVKFLVHGYKMSGFSHFSHHLTDAYLRYGEESNVFCVDWKRLAADYIYFNSAFNTRVVGEALGEFIVYLHNQKLIDSYQSVHIIGFSLGAHVAGYAGKFVWRTQNGKIGRISGLDPAGPAFTGPHPRNRLDKEDAEFVDIIHTSIGKSGISESIGHVDFFPNGGLDQPGCLWEKVTSAFLRNCSHERSFFLFLESIKGEKFLGCPCRDWSEYQRASCRCTTKTEGAALLGEYCPKTARGNKYLTTRAVLLQHIS